MTTRNRDSRGVIPGAPATFVDRGSIAFGVSAVAGYINPVTGQVHNAGRADTQTLIGALCFLIGASSSAPCCCCQSAPRRSAVKRWRPPPLASAHDRLTTPEGWPQVAMLCLPTSG